MPVARHRFEVGTRAPRDDAFDLRRGDFDRFDARNLWADANARSHFNRTVCAGETVADYLHRSKNEKRRPDDVLTLDP